MESDLESAAWKGEPSARPATPLWVWLVGLALGALTIYAGYEALDRDRLYREAENARAALAREKDRLQANANDLNRQLEDANRRNEATEAAFKQSRRHSGGVRADQRPAGAGDETAGTGDRPAGRGGRGGGQCKAGD
jgi:hypothetical protein